MRKNSDSNSGLVNWPTNLKNTGEGGMVVYAIWESMNAECCVDVDFTMFGNILDEWWKDAVQERLRELKRVDANSFTHPSVSDIVEDEFDGKLMVSAQCDPNLSKDMGKHLYLAEQLYLGSFPAIPISGAVYLGSSGGSWWTGEDYWTATMDDLKAEGLELIERLNAVYGSEARLITVLDT